MSEKKKVRFTIVDAVVLIAILAVAGFVGVKFLGIGSSGGSGSEAKTFIVSYYFEEVPDFAAELVKKDDDVSDEAKKHALGKVTDVEVGEAAVYCADSAGVLRKSAKEGYRSVKLTTEVEGFETKHGMTVSGSNYVVGHTMTVYAGGAKLYGKVSGIKEK